MLIFLYGPDDYRREQKKKDLIAEFVKKRTSLGLRPFDFQSKEDVAQFEEFGANQSVFGSAKLAVALNAFEMEVKELAKLLKPFAARKDITVLLSERDKPVKPTQFLVEEPSFSQKFENLEGPAWTSFIMAEAKKLGLILSPSATQFLGAVHQGNTWALITELQKIASLSSLSSPSPRALSKEDLDDFDLESAPNYWALMNGLKSPDPKLRLIALEKMLALNDPPAKIFNILASQWQEKIPEIADLDFQVKSGKLEYEEALLEILIR